LWALKIVQVFWCNFNPFWFLKSRLQPEHGTDGTDITIVWKKEQEWEGKCRKDGWMDDWTDGSQQAMLMSRYQLEYETEFIHARVGYQEHIAIDPFINAQGFFISHL
jgi:hypothetical protein